MKTFLEFINDRSDVVDMKDKIRKISEFLSRVEGFNIHRFLENENDPHVFITVDDKDLPLIKKFGIGFRIFIAGKELVYRVQIKKKGVPVGLAKKLEYLEDIEKSVFNGKTEEEAYNEMKRVIPLTFKKTLSKIEKNLKNIQDNKQDINSLTNNDIHIKILSSLLTADKEEPFKM